MSEKDFEEKYNNIQEKVRLIQPEVKSFLFSAFIWEKLFNSFKDDLEANRVKEKLNESNESNEPKEGFLHKMTRHLFFKNACISLMKIWDKNRRTITFYKINKLLNEAFISYLITRHADEYKYGLPDENLLLIQSDIKNDRKKFFQKMDDIIKKYESRSPILYEKFEYIKNLRNKRYAHISEERFEEREDIESDFFKPFIEDALFIIYGLSGMFGIKFILEMNGEYRDIRSQYSIENNTFLEKECRASVSSFYVPFEK